MSFETFKSHKLLQKRINYYFKNPNLIIQALTHSSYANETQIGRIASNERMEYLGDALLETIISTYLYKNFPDLEEGELTTKRAELVCESSLYEAAKRISLGDYIMLGNGEVKDGGKDKPSILSDAIEALIAAIFLDSSYNPAEKFVNNFIIDKDYTFVDYKSALARKMNTLKDCIPEYKKIGYKENECLFVEGFFINGDLISKGEGKTKKSAQQLAAKEALERLD